MVFCNKILIGLVILCIIVTILILVDGFLQSIDNITIKLEYKGHNPYFSRWFSAISEYGIYEPVDQCHNPYFSRWFSAIGILFKQKIHE